MSEIPFVNLLGDELERAARRAQPSRARRRRLGLLALAGALLVSGSALAGGLLFGDAEHQATAHVACYDGADSQYGGSVAVVPPVAGSSERSPVDLCRSMAGLSGPLVACATSGGVAVVPGRGREDCAAAGFGPLSRDYPAARDRTARLERAILDVEESADCIPPAELAHRVQDLFEREGWTGWTARVSPGGADGPCGSVSMLRGDGRRSMWLDADAKEVQVSGVGPRRLMDLLYSADRSLLVPLFAESGARCFSFDGFMARAREVFGAKGIDVTTKRTALPANTGLDNEDGRWTRYQAGCAVLAGGAPGPDRDSVVIEVFQRRSLR